MPKLKPGTIVPTPEEDAAINAGIAADPDTYELTDDEWDRIKPMVRMGRPPVDTPKVFTGIRLDADIVDTFKASGKGWQTRMNAALRDWLKTHSPV